MKHEENKYEDMIYLPRHVSVKHPQMSLQDRAAQFSPFAALTGHDAAIRETARLTDTFVELEEDQKTLLDEKLPMLRENLAQDPEVKVTFFRPDSKKGGGAYVTIRGRVKKIDLYGHRILFRDGTDIPLENLFSIEGEIFRGMD